MARPLRHHRLALLAVSLLAWACAGPTPAPSVSPVASPSASTAPTSQPSASSSASAGPIGSQDPAVYEAINAQVQAIRGLDEKRPVVPSIVSQQELNDVLQASTDRDYPAKRIAGDQLLYQGLGLLSKDTKLEDVLVELLQSQVAGLYDPSTKKLYVLSKAGAVGPTERFFYSHEYDHALQDQHFDLLKFQAGLEDDSDRLLAHQALVEGDAYVTMTYWLQQNLTPAETSEVLAGANDPAAMAALQKIPPIIQAQITFAATQGTLWVIAQQRNLGWAGIDADFASPPESTEQILHPDKWAAHEKPIEVKLPADLAKRMGSGWSLDHEDTFGEQQTGIWLGGVSQAAAAQGWGGDRIALLRGPSDTWAIAWHTVWDSADDATEFETAATFAVNESPGKGSVLPGEGGTTRWVVIGSDATVLGKLANVLGLAG
jgi:hypothetical protein